MTDVLLNAAFTLMCDLIFVNSSLHKLKITHKIIKRYLAIKCNKADFIYWTEHNFLIVK